uniref:Uncharacterized protein n=1 Tax=Tetraselmis sp. GSL018 TaxID=582737 RepID=A0A061R018_9CHLO
MQQPLNSCSYPLPSRFANDQKPTPRNLKEKTRYCSCFKPKNRNFEIKLYEFSKQMIFLENNFSDSTSPRIACRQENNAVFVSYEALRFWKWKGKLRYLPPPPQFLAQDQGNKLQSSYTEDRAGCPLWNTSAYFSHCPLSNCEAYSSRNL